MGAGQIRIRVSWLIALWIPTCLTIVLLVLPSPGYTWGGDGHRIVGALADRMLVGTTAELEVHKLLLHGETLERIAMWADCAKGYCGELTAEMAEFVQAHPDHHQYHFSNVPFQYPQYDPASLGISQPDVVSILAQAIRVLQGQQEAPNGSVVFTPRQALLLLVHLVGDLHQPLHVGSAYLDPAGHFVNPPRSEDLQSGNVFPTYGGNSLLIGGGRNLHAYWDSSVVRYAMKRVRATSVESYVDYVMGKYSEALEVEIGHSEPSEWPRQWAEDSLRLAKEAHRGLVVGTRQRVQNSQQMEHWVWSVSVPDEYDRRSSAAAEQAIVQAGKRLALVLQAIWPAKK